MKKRDGKMSCRVLMLRSNPVRPDTRVEKEAASLTRCGYDVCIFCWDRDSNHKECCEEIIVAKQRIPIVRVGFRASYGEGFKNIIPYLKFQFSLRRWIRKHKQEFDIVHACDFDTSFFSHKLVKRLKKYLVFDIFDFLYGEPHSFLQKQVKKAQLRIINRADATIICSEERREQIKNSSPKKLIVIHNSPSVEQLPTRIKLVPRLNDCIRICYVGILQDGRMIKEIGNYLAKKPGFEFHVGGFGPLDTFFKDLTKNCGNVFFYGRIPYAQTLELEANCDIMLGIYDPKIENHRYAAPNKFYESLFLGKPIIMVKHTGMSDIVEKKGFGSLMDFFDINSFDVALKQIVKMKSQWPIIREEMNKEYKTLYSWSEMERRLIELYDSFCLEGESR